MPTQKEFEEKVGKFPKFEEARDQIYYLALNLVKSGYEVEAYILILSTWNFAGFRFKLKQFDMNIFRKTISEINPIFERLSNKNFRDADFEDATLCEDIKKIYGKLRGIVGQTGASKIMHLKNPNLFVMWDTGIRKKYKIRNKASPEDYISFLRKSKREFGSIKCENRERTFAKAIDEYNIYDVELKMQKKKKK
jgi:hypothetical protein